MAAKKHSIAVRRRFIQLMRQVIAHRLSGVATETAFASAIGILQTNMNKISAGERYPTLEMICNACIVFNASPAWLITGDGEMFLSKEIQVPKIPKEIPKLLKKKTA